MSSLYIVNKCYSVK